MNLVQSLLSLSGYPIPRPLVLNALEEEDLDPSTEATTQTRNSTSYKRCKMKVYQFLSTAPNVSQGGISYSFTDADKADFKRMAQYLANEVDDNTINGGVEYGYQGDSF